jgi:hypothetical protein
MQRSEVFSTPEPSTAVAPTRVTTTLYDIIVALQTLVEPEDDALVVAIVAAWLRSGRLRVPAAATIAALEGRTSWLLGAWKQCWAGETR